MKIQKNEYVAFALGLTNFIQIKSFAIIILLEVTAVFFFIIKILFTYTIKKSNSNLNTHYFKRFYLLGFIWLISQYISDKINATNPIDTVKILAQIVVLLVLIYWAQSWLQIKKALLTSFVLGYCISVIPNYFLTPNTYILEDPWKFGFGFSLTIVVFLWFSKIQVSTPIQIFITLTLTLIDLLLGSRGLALLTMISWASCLPARKILVKKSSIALSLLAIVVAGLIASITYQELALSGKIGVQQQIKASQQIGSGPLLLVARSEFVYEIVAIKNNLLLGMGSNPDITSKIASEVNQLNSKLKIDQNNTAAFQYIKLTGKIPQHSLLLTFWMFGGIPAALFWIYVFIMLTRWVIQIRIRNCRYFYLSRYLYITFVWNLFFSPLGAGQRVLFAMTVAVILTDYIDSKNHELV
jgi:hypothetical protein